MHLYSGPPMHLHSGVDTRPRNDGKVVYTVKLATLKTIGIIEVLQRLLRNRSLTELEDAVLLTLQEYDDSASGDDDFDGSTDITTTSPPYVWGTMKWGYFTWS